MKINNLTLQQRLALVKRELVEGGISKDSKQKFQNYDYRGVDQVLGVISALHVKYGINVKVDNIIDFNMEHRVDGKGKAVIHMTALYHWCFQNSDDQKDADFCMSIGEGMDTGDKSSGKMQSYAYKNMMFYRYEIPIKGQSTDSYDPRIDNEDETHESDVDPGKNMQSNVKKIRSKLEAKDTTTKTKSEVSSWNETAAWEAHSALKEMVDKVSSNDTLLPAKGEEQEFRAMTYSLKKAVKQYASAFNKGEDREIAQSPFTDVMVSANSIINRLPKEDESPSKVVLGMIEEQKKKISA